MTKDSDTPEENNSFTRRALLAAGTASMMGLAGCSSGGGKKNKGGTSKNTPTPEPVTGELYSEINIKRGDLVVKLGNGDTLKKNVKRLALIGPVVGGGDTAETNIHPSSNRNSGEQNGVQALKPKQIPRKPVYKSKQLPEGQTKLTFSLLQAEYNARTNNYQSGIYYLLAFGKKGILAQRRISLVPILSLLSVDVSESGGLLLTIKNIGTGPCYPAYGITSGTMQPSQGEPLLFSGGNGIFAETFILPPSKEGEYLITTTEQSPFGAPFSYPRTNSTEGSKYDFSAESSAYCTGSGIYSHNFTIVLGLVSGGYVSTEVSVTLGGDPKLVESEPSDQILCSSLRVTSPLPRQFTPVQWLSKNKISSKTGNEGQTTTTSPITRHTMTENNTQTISSSASNTTTPLLTTNTTETVTDSNSTE